MAGEHRPKRDRGLQTTPACRADLTRGEISTDAVLAFGPTPRTGLHTLRTVICRAPKRESAGLTK